MAYTTSPRDRSRDGPARPGPGAGPHRPALRERFLIGLSLLNPVIIARRDAKPSGIHRLGATSSRGEGTMGSPKTRLERPTRPIAVPVEGRPGQIIGPSRGLP